MLHAVVGNLPKPARMRKRVQIGGNPTNEKGVTFSGVNVFHANYMDFLKRKICLIDTVFLLIVAPPHFWDFELITTYLNLFSFSSFKKKTNII